MGNGVRSSERPEIENRRVYPGPDHLRREPSVFAEAIVGLGLSYHPHGVSRQPGPAAGELLRQLADFEKRQQVRHLEDRHDIDRGVVQFNLPDLLPQ